jgi:hypothetical protein
MATYNFEWEDSDAASETTPNFHFSLSIKGMCTILHSLNREGGILVVGDSLSSQFTMQLAALMEARPCDESAPFSESNQRWCMCGGRQKLWNIRNDLLDTSPSYPPGGEHPSYGSPCYEGASNKLCNPWASSDTLRQFSVVVVNSGAHYEADDPFSRYTAGAADLLAAHRPPLELVYRNTVPGHGDCAQIHAPFNSVGEAEEWVDTHRHYDSPNFKRQNLIAQEIFASRGFSLIDAYNTTVTRGDVHIDCLHLCVPGPMVLWVDMLYSILANKHLVDR